MSRPDRIFLIGYRGTGKSSVGRVVAEQLEWAFADTDAAVEAAHGPIAAIFAERGEAAFRDLEAATLAELALRKDIVISTGGGCVTRPANQDVLATGLTVRLTADPQTIHERVTADPQTARLRPNLTTGGLAEIEQLLRKREPLYRECADMTIDTAGLSADQVAMTILREIDFGDPA